MIKFTEIQEAAARLKGVAYVTPLIYSYSLSELTGVHIHLKLENLQRTGSFKIRGAYNKLFTLRGKTENVIAASAGNHAQGVALAAQILGMRATLIMPQWAPINKILAVKDYGAKVVLHGDTFDEAQVYAKKSAEEKGYTIIHAFDDPVVIAGQGAVGLEIFESLKELDTVFVPVGGGGLISGIAIAIKEFNPNVKVIGVQSSSVQSMYLSIKQGKIVQSTYKRTLADGIAIKHPGKLTFETIKAYVDDMLTVSEDEIEDALLLLTERKRILVEGAGAVGLAGLIKCKEELQGKRCVIVVSGGNIDINILSRIIERGLVQRGRFIRLVVELPDEPGSLGKLSSLLGTAKANIVQIHHDRFSRDIPIDKAIVEISLETKGFEHQNEILLLLRENGYKAEKK